jgi:hypothetical protein
MLKLDNRLIKYLIIIVIIYFIVSKVPSDQLPGNNPFLLTGILSTVLYIVDQPNILFEHFDPSAEEKNKNTIVIDKNTLKSVVDDVFNEKKAELIRMVVPPSPPVANANVEATKVESVPTPTVVPIPESLPTTTVTITEHNPQVNQITEKFEENNTTNEVHNPIGDMLTSGLPSTAKIITDTIIGANAQKCDCEAVANKAITNFLQNRRMLDNNGMMHYADSYIGDMGYSQIKLDKYIPQGADGNGAYRSWELGQYNILNTDRWKPPTDPTPRCKSDTMPDPQPMDSKLPMNLMNYEYSRRVTPAQNINVKYITDKLNQ